MHDALAATNLLVDRGHGVLKADSRGNTPQVVHIAIKGGHGSAAEYRYLLSLSARIHPDLLVTFRR